ncbi:MAG: hypothetical protein WBC05_01615 [Sedimentisphaerales bacterium]
MNSSQRKKFIWYFRKRLKSLNYCNATFESTIEAEKQGLTDSVNNGKIQPNSPELNKAFFEYDYHILPTFRNCMLLGACTLIEDVLLRFGTDIIPDFKVHVHELSRSRMSTVRKYLQVLESQLTIDFTFIENDLQLIDDIFKIRNAIAHAWGKIDSCNNHAALRVIISRRSWVQETGDGYILVEDVAYADAITPVLTLVEHILDSVPVSDD